MVEEVRLSVDRRFASEQRRYSALYGVNPTDPLNFDLVLNTKHNGLKTVTAILVVAKYCALASKRSAFLLKPCWRMPG